MLGKIFWAVIGGGCALFALVIIWPALDAAQNATEANISAAQFANATGLQAGMNFSQLGLWLGFVAIPLIIIAVYAWKRRQRGA